MEKIEKYSRNDDKAILYCKINFKESSVNIEFSNIFAQINQFVSFLILLLFFPYQ